MGVPYASTKWDEIVPGLFQGGHDYRNEFGRVRDVVVGDEFDLVISLYRRDGCGPGPNVVHHQCIVPDGMLLLEERNKIAKTAGIAAEAVEQGKRVLVRCQAGYNRSGLVVAMALMRMGWPANGAIEQIRTKRSEYALFNYHFLEYLREEEGRSTSAL